eukprot:TRINITY_DN14711_c0_g1_i2.p1 TRINITY_DN14711_c0_g1~~TRINITY_DN14711_c0_g1_i2.p1  ORF type:complete len:123 (-),score=14.45 TRINITY_DN14711_c0_g1_i2:32-400(-)
MLKRRHYCTRRTDTASRKRFQVECCLALVALCLDVLMNEGLESNVGYKAATLELKSSLGTYTRALQPLCDGTPLVAMAIRRNHSCLLYTSDAADEEDSVDLGGRRVIKKKKKVNTRGEGINK